MRQSISLIARLPAIMSYAYQVKRRHFDKEACSFTPLNRATVQPKLFLNALRPDRKKEEARLDLCMQSTEAATIPPLPPGCFCGDRYLFGHRRAIGSLKGFSMAAQTIGSAYDGRCNGAREGLKMKTRGGPLPEKNPERGGGPRGLIMGWATRFIRCQTPGAVILKSKAKGLAEKDSATSSPCNELVERLSPEAFQRVTGNSKVISANVDFYSRIDL